MPLTEFMAEGMAPRSTSVTCWSSTSAAPAAPAHSRARPWNAQRRLDSKLFEQCAMEIGPARGGFTSEESVADIEALRVAGGYQKLVLYGTSYGTKVALEYAQQYPQNVEALVLDSASRRTDRTVRDPSFARSRA